MESYVITNLPKSDDTHASNRMLGNGQNFPKNLNSNRQNHTYILNSINCFLIEDNRSFYIIAKNIFFNLILKSKFSFLLQTYKLTPQTFHSTNIHTYIHIPCRNDKN